MEHQQFISKQITNTGYRDIHLNLNTVILSIPLFKSKLTCTQQFAQFIIIIIIIIIIITTTVEFHNYFFKLNK